MVLLLCSLLIWKAIWLVPILSFTAGVVEALLNSCQQTGSHDNSTKNFNTLKLRHLKHESLELAATYVVANTHRPTKQWNLTKNETVNNLKNWRQNFMFIHCLSQVILHHFFVETSIWAKKTRAQPLCLSPKVTWPSLNAINPLSPTMSISQYLNCKDGLLTDLHIQLNHPSSHNLPP